MDSQVSKAKPTRGTSVKVNGVIDTHIHIHHIAFVYLVFELSWLDQHPVRPEGVSMASNDLVSFFQSCRGDCELTRCLGRIQ